MKRCAGSTAEATNVALRGRRRVGAFGAMNGTHKPYSRGSIGLGCLISHPLVGLFHSDWGGGVTTYLRETISNTESYDSLADKRGFLNRCFIYTRHAAELACLAWYVHGV